MRGTLSRSISLLPSIVAGVAVATALTLATGCKEEPKGPKRADHEAAHRQRYHPDVARSPDPAQSQPATDTAPAFDPYVSEPVGCPVLFVNGETITVQDILEPLMSDLQREARTMSPEDYRSSAIDRVNNQIYYQVNTILLYYEAQRDFPEKAQEMLDKEVAKEVERRIIDEFGGIQARFEDHLKKLDLKRTDVEARIKRQIMVAQYQHTKFFPLVPEPSRRELMAYYQAHLGDFTTPRKAHMLLIEVPLSNELQKPLDEATEDEIAVARKRALAQLEQARQELDSGVEFKAAARRYSKGIKAVQGGDWGEISPGALTRRWAKAEEVLFTLDEGQISAPIDTGESVLIVKCAKQTPAHRASFEEAQPEIVKRLKDQRFDELALEYIRKLRDQATIRKLPEFMQAVLAAAPRPERTVAGALEKPR